MTTYTPSELATRAIIKVLREAFQNPVGEEAQRYHDIIITSSPVDEEYARKFDGSPAIIVASDYRLQGIIIGSASDRIAIVESRIMILSESLRELSILSMIVMGILLRNQDLLSHYAENKITPTRIMVDSATPRVTTATVTRPYNAKVVGVVFTAPMTFNFHGELTVNEEVLIEKEIN